MLHHGKSGETAVVAQDAPLAAAPRSEIAVPEGMVAIAAPMQGTIVSIDVIEGDLVHR